MQKIYPAKTTNIPYIPQFFHPPENLTYQYGICNNFIDFDNLHILIVSQSTGIWISGKYLVSEGLYNV